MGTEPRGLKYWQEWRQEGWTRELSRIDGQRAEANSPGLFPPVLSLWSSLRLRREATAHLPVPWAGAKQGRSGE